MKFKVHSDMQYDVLQPSTFIFNVHALRTTNQFVQQEELTTNPYIPMEEFTSKSSLNRFVRLKVLGGTNFKISYNSTIDSNCEVVYHKEILSADVVAVDQLDGDVIPFLFPSRYCQSDKLQKFAFDKFGQITNPYIQVLTISDWIYNNVQYLSGSTDSHTSAFDTITERAGVCRDFAHLGIALCRALTIPARYFTGYAFRLQPQDFHACFEAYIGGKWIIFDATKLIPLNALVKIATGRDAADAAVASIFGSAICNSIQVNCETLENNFEPFLYNKGNFNCLSY